MVSTKPAVGSRPNHIIYMEVRVNLKILLSPPPFLLHLTHLTHLTLEKVHAINTAPFRTLK